MNKKYYIYTMPTDNVIYMYLLNISIECIYMYLTSLYICYLYQSIFDSLCVYSFLHGTHHVQDIRDNVVVW